MIRKMGKGSVLGSPPR